MLCTALYSENILSTYNLDYESIKLVTANILIRNGRAQAVLWRQCIGQVIGHVGQQRGGSFLGVPGSTHNGTLQ